MEIIVNKEPESFVFTMPDGEQVEVMIIQVSGEDMRVCMNMTKAIDVFKNDLQHLGSLSNSLAAESNLIML